MSKYGDVTGEELEAFRRFLALLPHGKDQLLVILKGHLLVEELLRRIVDERSRKPTALRVVRFECSHIISIAEAFCAGDVEPWVWDALRGLNTLRNDIAHKLEPRGREDRLRDLVSLVRKNSVFAEEGFGTNDVAVQFEYCLWVLFATLVALLKRPPARLLRLVSRK